MYFDLYKINYIKRLILYINLIYINLWEIINISVLLCVNFFSHKNPISLKKLIKSYIKIWIKIIRNSRL